MMTILCEADLTEGAIALYLTAAVMASKDCFQQKGPEQQDEGPALLLFQILGGRSNLG